MADRYWVGSAPTSFFVGSQETAPQGLFFKPDGTKMYVVGASGDDVNEYDLSTAWDISTASYLQTFYVGSQESSPRAVFFGANGTKMYITGTSGDDINEYDLSTAWDVSTASFLQSFSVAAQETGPQGLFFRSDGIKMYIVGSTGDDVNEYDLSTAWDVSTASYLQNFSVAAQDTQPVGIFFKPDGTKMYVAGFTGVDINEYDLSTAWDISTASYLQNYNVSAQETFLGDVFFKSDGTKMYIVGYNSDSVWAYDLTTAWDISTTRGKDVWDGTAGSKWSTTSGGAGGASVPTTADDVFLDSNSTSPVEIVSGNTGAKSINCTGYINTLSGSATITIAGSLTLSAGMTYSRTGETTFTGTGTITSAGKTLNHNIVINGSGITVSLGDALAMTSRTLTVTQGTLNTANYSLTTGSLTSTGTTTRGITLGSSAVSLSLSSNAIEFSTGTNLTFNAGTSTISLTSVAATINGSGQTFYDVNFSATSGTGNIRYIYGANTFNNLTFSNAFLGMIRFEIADSQTVNGTFACSGFSSYQRAFVYSADFGVAKTITANAVSADDCDFRDITIAGAAAPISPTRAGDCGGNSGINFPTPKTVYRVGTNTTWYGSSSWALSSGGTGDNNNFPLAQDTAVIDNSTTLTGTLLLNVLYNYGTLSCSTRTTAITLSFSTAGNYHGDFALGSGTAITGAGQIAFLGRTTQTLTSAGKTLTSPITLTHAGSGVLQLNGSLTSTQSLSANGGSFNANNYSVTVPSFSSSGAITRTVTMGSGLWTLTGTSSVWNTGTTTNLTFSKGTADIFLSSTTTSTRTFSGGGLSYNKLTVGGATGTSVFSILDASNSFTELATTKTVAHTIRFGADQGTIGTWSVTGSAGNVVTVDSSSAGVRRTFTLTNITEGINYLSVKDIGVSDPDLFYVGSNSIDGGNNLNVIFSAVPGLGTGNFFMLF